MIRSYGISHVGQVRTNNEDSFLDEPQLNFFAVADGMGGAQAGERASQIAIRTMIEEVEGGTGESELEALSRAVIEANRRIREEASEHSDLAGMGTTMVAVIVRSPKAYIVNVGDSRAYLRSGDELYCVTTDHSWVNEVGRGLGLTEDQLRTHPYRNVLTKAVGAEDELEVQQLEIDFGPGDLLLLCSDGLHGVAGEQLLVDVLGRPTDLQDKGGALVQAVLDLGAPDNVTAVLIHDDGEAADPQLASDQS